MITEYGAFGFASLGPVETDPANIIPMTFSHNNNMHLIQTKLNVVTAQKDPSFLKNNYFYFFFPWKTTNSLSFNITL